MKKYALILAVALLLVMANLNMAVAAPGLQGGPSVHYVGFGESLSGIALRYGVSVEAIMQQNGLANPNVIYVGQPLVIPLGGGTYGVPSGPAACQNYHLVRAGETLSSIASTYGVPVSAFLECNSLANQNIVYVNQRLCVPGGYASPGYQNAPPGGYYHTVARGETLAGIASHYGINYMDIMRANNLNNPGLIVSGQQLAIPGYQPIAASYSSPVQPTYRGNPGQGYAPPANPAPPVQPVYRDGGDPPPASPPAVPPQSDVVDNYDETYAAPPPYDPPQAQAASVPPAPEYQAGAASSLLPRADFPIQVAVNGGVNWVDEVFNTEEADSVTTLEVHIDQQDVKKAGDERADDVELPVVKIRSGDYEVEGDGEQFPNQPFVFRYIPPGDYDIWLDDPLMPSEKVQVSVEPGKKTIVTFREGVTFPGSSYASPDGWFLASWDNSSKPRQNIGGWSTILVKAPASGLNVLIESEGGWTSKCFTGSKGPGMCEIPALNAGVYYLRLAGTDLTVKTYMDGQAYATFEFARQPVPREGRDKIGPVNY